MALDYDALCKRLERYKNRLKELNKKLEVCSDRAVKKRESIQEQIYKIEEMIEDIEPVIVIEKKRCTEELDIVKGWFFYSSAYIDRTVKYINHLNPIEYNKVVELLSAPEKFVGSLQAFTKGE